MTIKTLKDGKPYVKANHHNDKILTGDWEVTYKIDGVRAFRTADGAVQSRASKPLYNLDSLEFSDAEIFRSNWETSVSLVRSSVNAKTIFQSDVYELGAGSLDKRLETGITLHCPTFDMRMNWMREAVELGYEGIVLRNHEKNLWVKVVPKQTIDIRITGFNMSTKRIGYIMNFETNWGKISATGFPVTELEVIKSNGAESYLNSIAEVEFREWTNNKKMRFVNWVRWRFEKSEESLS